MATNDNDVDSANELSTEGAPPALPAPLAAIAPQGIPKAPQGIIAWLDDRAGLSDLIGFASGQGAKLVPRNLSWLYSMGTLAAFFFGLQFLTGLLMVMAYVPDEKLAFNSVQMIEHRLPLGWLVRQMHAWGANLVVIVLLLHIFKVLWIGSYKRPREFTWFAGAILFSLALGFCFSGYLLPWNQLSFWATRVGIGAADKVPWIGPALKGFLCGGADVSGKTLGRFFALHVIFLPWIFLPVVGIHFALILRHGITPKTTITEEQELGDMSALARHGAESFFPRQIYRELLACNLGFAILVTLATFFPWEIGEPKSFETPVGIKPEWYFLPVYQFLKYFDKDLLGALPFLDKMMTALGWGPELLGIMLINVFAAAFFLLPILDRGRHRKITRRPLFALIAFTAILGIGSLGVLGYLSERTIKLWNGKTYHFTPKGYPELAEAAAEPATQLPAAQASAASPASPAVTFRSDGLPPGGTCGSASCHADELEKWQGSVHEKNQIECKACHGGIDTAQKNKLPNGPSDEDYAHTDMKRKKKKIDGKEAWVAAKPAKSEHKDLCGKCHLDVRDVFSDDHLGKEPSKSCVNCHSNHKVRPADDATFEKGYSDETDPRTAAFQFARKTFADLVGELNGAEAQLEELRKLGYPVEGIPFSVALTAPQAAALKKTGFPSSGLKDQVERAREKFRQNRYAVHKLDKQLIEVKAAEVREALQPPRDAMTAALASRDDRWKLVAGVWGAVLFLSALIILKLRRIPK